MVTKTTEYPKLGVARFARTCPACGEVIPVSNPVAHQGKTWVHPSCYFDPRLKKADDQIKDAFFATVC